MVVTTRFSLRLNHAEKVWGTNFVVETPWSGLGVLPGSWLIDSVMAVWAGFGLVISGSGQVRTSK